MSRAADALTLARVAAGVGLPLALARSVDRPGGAWTPLELWTVGAASDLLDGPLARRLGSATRHGALLDSLADVVFVLGAAFGGVALGLLSGWVPAAIAVAFGAYALASVATEAGAAVRAYTRIGHAAGVCNYLLAGLLAAAVAWPARRPVRSGGRSRPRQPGSVRGVPQRSAARRRRRRAAAPRAAPRTGSACRRAGARASAS